jgi:glyoxylase-like metal-dependent hydrolase (beta-lactamase superfamily II)
MSSRAIGEAIVTVVSDGSLLWVPRFPAEEAALRQAMPDADAAGRIRIGLNIVLVQLGEARIVIDPALDDPGTGFERTFAAQLAAAGSPIEITRSPGLAAALVALGWEPETVTHVVITHPHGDHYGGVTVERDGALHVRFPQARHFVGRADWEGNPRRTEPNSELERRLGAVERLGLLELVVGEKEIIPGVTLLPAPGESPGHQIVRIESADESLYIVGDLIHHACEVAHPEWTPPHADAGATEATRRRFFPELARTGALVISAHELFSPWRRIVSAGAGFSWEEA